MIHIGSERCFKYSNWALIPPFIVGEDANYGPGGSIIEVTDANNGRKKTCQNKRNKSNQQKDKDYKVEHPG